MRQVGISVEPANGLVEPKQSCALTVVLRASRELRLDGTTLSADIRGGKAAKVSRRVARRRYYMGVVCDDSVGVG